MAEVDIVSLSISLGTSGLLLLGSLLKLYLQKRIVSSKDVGIIIPSNGGKSTLLEKLRQYGETLNLYVIDIEDLTMLNPEISKETKEHLEQIKMIDSILYQSKMLDLTKAEFNKFRINIVKSNPKIKIVVLASTRAILNNLGITTVYSMSPSTRLLHIISNCEGVSKLFIKFCMDNINTNSKTTYTYQDFDSLAEIVMKILGLTEKNGRTLASTSI